MWYVGPDQEGFTALLYAARHGHAHCVRLLIERGADKEVKSTVRDVVICLLRVLYLRLRFHFYLFCCFVCKQLHSLVFFRLFGH